MVDVVVRQRAYQALASRLVEIAPPNWVEVCLGVQAPPNAADTDLLGVTLAAVNLGDRWGFGQVDQEPITYELAHTAWEASAPEAWTTLEMTVQIDGSFETRLGYEPVPADGSFDPAFMERLQDYPATFATAHGPAPHAG